MIAKCYDKPGKVSLAELDPRGQTELTKEEAKALTDELGKELDALELLLYAAGTHSMLIVLQGMDTSGKDGTTRRLLRYLNSLGTKCFAFGKPTELELAHDYLWRIHHRTPPKGNIAIFNRSHYEDVLVVRVRNLVPESVWSQRYDQINHFEESLAANNTLIVKILLNLSKDEQEQRLLERETNPEKGWKLNCADWEERKVWEDYMHAYEVAIGKCASKQAPWYVVPADRKWLRDLAVMEAVLESLRPFRDAWTKKVLEIGERNRQELEEYRKREGSGG